MREFSWFGPALFALAGVAWWEHPLEKAAFRELTTKERWLRRLARLAMFALAMVVLVNISDFSRVKGSEVEVEIPYSFQAHPEPGRVTYRGKRPAMQL
jgi:hypothetical protein